MESLNYQHLFYFWVISREGGVARAAKHLHLTHSTLSAQLRLLERFLGGELFERGGRRLVPTPLGLEVAAHAEDIFRMGNELVEVARGKGSGARSAFKVGVVGSLPKTIAYRLIEPALSPGDMALLQVRQDTQARLTEELAAGRLHVVLSDTPPQAASFRLHAHVLGESDTLLYGTAKLARRYGKSFPASLEGAPVVLPAAGALRRALDRWFADRGVRVRVAGEMDDAGMIRVFGGHGLGLFPVREALRTEVEEAHHAVCLGPLDGVRERYYAISVERRIRHPAVVALVDSARATLKAPPGRAAQ
jgi:LysR family transcriptional regulator, transcriptional activator of nhaA